MKTILEIDPDRCTQVSAVWLNHNVHGGDYLKKKNKKSILEKAKLNALGEQRTTSTIAEASDPP